MNKHETLHKLANAITQVVNEYRLIKQYNQEYILTTTQFHNLVRVKSGLAWYDLMTDVIFDEMVLMIDIAYTKKIKNA